MRLISVIIACYNVADYLDVCINSLVNQTIGLKNIQIILVDDAGVVLSKNMLFNRIWGSDSESEEQTLTVHIKRLREKIEEDPKKPKHILTAWGTGYRYEA